MDIAKGDNVTVNLTGQSIPQIKEIIWRVSERNLVLPEQNQFTPLTCFNYSTSCHEQFLSRLTWLSSKQGLNFNNISKGTWNKLINANKLTILTDWLDLTYEDLITIDGIGNKQASAILLQFNSIQFNSAKKATFKQWLTALGLTGLPNEANQYQWQLLVNWSTNDWKNNTQVTSKKAEQYQQITQIINQDQIQILSKHQIQGFK